MSDSDEALVIKQVIEWIERKKKDGTGIICELCGKSHWVIGKHAVVPLIYKKEGISIGGGPAYPFAMLTCSNCGNTKFMNTVIMGMTEPSKSPPEKGVIEEEHA